MPGRIGLVHQVVAEDCRTVLACVGDGFPKDGLRFPAILFVQLVVPVRNVLLVITGQTGGVQIQPCVFCELYQFCKLLNAALFG